VLVGKALYGPRWQTDLAGDLRVSDRTMRRWVARTEVPRRAVLSDLAAIVKARQIELQKVENVLHTAEHAIAGSSACGR
jgi:hypothetical protein